MSTEIKDIRQVDDTPRKLILAIVISPIISYLIIAYNTYIKYKEHNADFNVSGEFFANEINYMLQHIGIGLEFLFMLASVSPIILIFVLTLVIIYFFVFYKIFTSKILFIIKCRTILFTLMLVSLYLFLEFLSELMIA